MSAFQYTCRLILTHSLSMVKLSRILRVAWLAAIIFMSTTQVCLCGALIYAAPFLHMWLILIALQVHSDTLTH